MKTILLTSALVALATTLQAATFTVTTTADSGAGSLRQAIVSANADSDIFGTAITFAIQGTPPHVITPLSPLPMINGSINLLNIGAALSNNAPTIVLNGGSAGATANGLTLGSFVTLTGLAITGFGDAGVLINTNQTGTAIFNCVITGNGGPGVRSLGNINTIQANTITGNGEDGVVVTSTAIRNRITQNSITQNGSLNETNAIGIDLLPAALTGGVTPNDNCDGDSGGNNLQNFPILTSATSDGITTTISGTITSTATRLFIVEFFVNVSCDVSGNGEGESYIGSTNIITDASCGAPINAVLPVGLANGIFITATATDGNFGNTSEFSPCVPLISTIGSAPVASNDVYTTDQDTPLTVAAPGVLANDTDADSDPLTAVQVTGATHGTGTISANGALSYTPTAGFSGLDMLTYHANDGNNNSADAAVVISIGAATPTGSVVNAQLDAGVASVDITFAGVTAGGSTSILPIDPSLAGTVPGNFTIYSNIVFDITTTAVVTPPIDVCFMLTITITSNEFAMLRVLHNEAGTLVDRTTSADFATKTICAQVTSLSPFALATFQADPHDLAVTKLKAPKKVTLKEGTAPKPGKFGVSIQNLGPTAEVISNANVLVELIGLNIESLGGCSAPTLTLVAPTVFPIILAPKKKLNVSYTATIDCANDGLTGAGHEDYRTTVTIDRTALDGMPDTNPANDNCPRAASSLDKGCNKGVDALTDVLIKE